MTEDDTKPTRKRSKVMGRYIRRRAKRQLSQGRQVWDHMTQINALKAEINLLTTYSTDVIYRLRYDSMCYDYISPSVERLLGYSPEEMTRMNFRSLIEETRIVTDDMREVRSFDHLEASRRQGVVHKWQADYKITVKDGRSLWVSDISYPWFDKRGNIVGSVGSLRDITDRIEAEARVKEELSRLANTDPLTGTANRRAFFGRLDEEVKRVRRNKAPLSILLLDIDHFKKINDSYGHEFGDQVICQVARIIQSCLRETDLLARLGGEEYGVFLPDTPQSGAYWVAERIRSQIAQHNFSPKESSPIGCTVSIGVADGHTDNVTDSTQLYKCADTRLYIAKNTGRNQVSTDEIVAMH